MTGRERLAAILAGRPADRPALVLPGGLVTAPCAVLLRELSLERRALHRDWRLLCRLSLALYRRGGLDAAGLPFRLTVESEAYGGEVEDDGSGPFCFDYPLRDAGRWRDLDGLDPERDGRLPAVLSLVRRLRRLLPDTPLIGDLAGPLALASALTPMDGLLKSLASGGAGVCGLLDFLAEGSARYAGALARAGCDALFIMEPAATAQVVGPRLLETMVVPRLRRLIEASCAAGCAAIVHLCGPLTSVAALLDGLGPCAFSIDRPDELPRLREALAGRVFMGGLDAAVLEGGSPGDAAAAALAAARRGFDIIAPGCAVTGRLRPENLAAASGALKRGVR
ncbi:MAG TPA: hypothetical protein ENJ37_05445 [Deltaproteobacteria bacterium]|nr:hypothetical protein [Deltaproteobacteria bacterium]